MSIPPTSDEEDRPHGENGPVGFQQSLGLFDSTMLVTGAMIGSGIFIVSAEMSRDLGSSGWLLLVWLLTGLMTISGALSYAELAAMMPQAGGQYVYLREAYGSLWGFLYGWAFFLVIQTGSIAAVGMAFAKFLGVLAPPLGIDPGGGAATLFQLDAFPISVGPFATKVGPFVITAGHLVAVAVVTSLTMLNCQGLREGKWVQNVFTVAKTLALIALIIVGLTIAADADVIARNTRDLWGGIQNTTRFQDVSKLVPVGGLAVTLMVAGGAMVGSLFSADAWNYVTFTAGEVRNPRRNLPLSLMLGTGMVIVLYLLANVAYLASLPLDGTEGAATPLERGIAHAKDDRVATAVLEQVSPRLGAKLMAVAIMISTFGCVNGLILMGARLYYAMARDGLFFQSVGKLNSRGVPAAGLILQGLWASVLVFSGKYNQLLDYVIFAALLFYVLTVVGLFVLRRTRPDAERPYRAWGYPVIPGLYVVACALIMLDLLIVKSKFTVRGLIIVATGIPVYFVWRAMSRSTLAAT